MGKWRNTRRRILPSLLSALLTLALTACSAGSGSDGGSGRESAAESGSFTASSAKEADGVNGSKAPEEAEAPEESESLQGTEGAKIRDAAKERDAAAMETDRAAEQAGRTTVIFFGNDTSERMLVKEVQLTEITAENLTKELIAAGVLEEGVEVNSMESSEKEGMTFLTLDFNRKFLEKLNRMGTSGEYFYMGGVVNTFLEAFDAYAVKITVDGEPAESGHNIYSEYLHYYKPDPGSLEGTYKFVKSEEPIAPSIHLSEDGTFSFQYSLLMSSIPMGSYTAENDKITMKRRDAEAVYVFEIEGENLVFDREESSDIGLEDGAVFEPGY